MNTILKVNIHNVQFVSLRNGMKPLSHDQFTTFIISRFGNVFWEPLYAARSRRRGHVYTITAYVLE